MLCRCLKPTLTRWPAEKVKSIFGPAVHDEWNAQCAKVDPQLGTLVARPLFACMRTLPKSNKICGAVVAMSPLVD